jgi:hypothetical protein
VLGLIALVTLKADSSTVKIIRKANDLLRSE